MTPVDNHVFARQFGGFGALFGLERERPSERYQRSTGPDHQRPIREDCMTALVALNAPIDSAQYQDPLIVNARLVNLAAEIERNLAARKAMRPARSAAASKGWRTRNDR